MELPTKGFITYLTLQLHFIVQRFSRHHYLNNKFPKRATSLISSYEAKKFSPLREEAKFTLGGRKDRGKGEQQRMNEKVNFQEQNERNGDRRRRELKLKRI